MASEEMTLREVLLADSFQREIDELKAQLAEAQKKAEHYEEQYYHQAEAFNRLSDELFDIGETLGMPYDDYQGEKTIIAEIASLSRKAEALDRLDELLIDVCQVFDGWHQDGTSWSEWDESVRIRCSTLLEAINEAVKVKGEKL